jgi:hypothetical protein
LTCGGSVEFGVRRELFQEVEDSFLETFYSLILEKGVYYNRKVAMGICFNPNE